MTEKRRKKEKKPHPRAALGIGFVGILIAVVAGILFGWIAGCVGALFGIIAMGLGKSARRQTDKKKGKGGLATGVIALLFAAVISIGLVVFSGKIGEIAEQKGFPQIARHARALSGGVVGMMIEMKEEDDQLQKAIQELNELGKKK